MPKLIIFLLFLVISPLYSEADSKTLPEVQLKRVNGSTVYKEIENEFIIEAKGVELHNLIISASRGINMRSKDLSHFSVFIYYNTDSFSLTFSYKDKNGQRKRIREFPMKAEDLPLPVISLEKGLKELSSIDTVLGIKFENPEGINFGVDSFVLSFNPDPEKLSNSLEFAIKGNIIKGEALNAIKQYKPVKYRIHRIYYSVNGIRKVSPD